MNITRATRAATYVVGVGITAIFIGVGAAGAIPLDPPPSPAPGGPAMAPTSSAPPTTNLTHPGVGPGGAHGGQNQTKAPGS